MTLYEFVNATQRDYDAFDDVYDVCVTVCHIPEEYIHDDYDRFCTEIIKKVEMIRQNTDSIVVCKWANLIERNFDKFKSLSNGDAEWESSYDDDDEEFVYQWIKEINGYMAGNVPEDFYSILLKFVNTLE